MITIITCIDCKQQIESFIGAKKEIYDIRIQKGWASKSFFNYKTPSCSNHKDNLDLAYNQLGITYAHVEKNGIKMKIRKHKENIVKEYFKVFFFSLILSPLLRYSVIDLVDHPGYLIGSILITIAYIFFADKKQKKELES